MARQRILRRVDSARLVGFISLGFWLVVSACSEDSSEPGAAGGAGAVGEQPVNADGTPVSGTPAGSASPTAEAMPPAPPEPGDVQWALTFGGSGDDAVVAIVSNEDDQILVAGHFEGSLSVGDFELQAAGEQDAFLALLDSQGAALWARNLAPQGFVQIADVGFLPNGGVVASGTLDGSLEWGASTLAGEGQQDLVVIQLDTSGEPGWGLTFGTDGKEFADAIGVDASGNTTVLGRGIAGGLQFADAGLAPDDDSSGDHLLLLRLDESGTLVWGKTFAAELSAQGRSMAVESGGSVFVAGSLEGELNLDSESITGTSDAFFAAFDTDGVDTWNKQTNSDEDDAVVLNAVDWRADRLLVAGSLRANSDLDSTPLTAVGGGDVVVASLADSGTLTYSKVFGGVDNETARAVQLGNSGEAFVAGAYQGAPTFGETTLPQADRPSTFLLSLDVNGDVQYATGILSNSRHSGLAVTRLSDGGAVVGGGFEGTIRVGGQHTASSGEADVMIVKLEPPTADPETAMPAPEASAPAPDTTTAPEVPAP